MIKCIFMDLDDTLLDFHKAEAMAIRRTLTQMLGRAPEDHVIARYAAINRRQWELLEQKKITRPELLLRRFELLFEEMGWNLSPQEAQGHYARFLGQGHDFMPNAEKLLDALWGRYRLCIVSNGNEDTQKKRLAAANISHYFEKIFISQLVGADKPSKLFFDRCFDALPGLRRQEVMILGDSLTSDILGAHNAGILDCWYNPAGKPRDIPVSYEIRDLMELPGLLEKINGGNP